MLPASCFVVTDDVPFDNICNSGTSRCAFYSQDFFTSMLTKPTSTYFLGGIANGLPIHGFGTATITLKMHKNKLCHLHIPNSLYVTDLTCNLLSPQWPIQSFQKQNKNSSFHIFPHGCLFLINNHIILLLYHPASNLPIFQLVPSETTTIMNDLDTSSSSEPLEYSAILHGFEATFPSLPTETLFHQTSTKYANLTLSQQQLYNWRVQLSHMNYATIQSMSQKDIGIPQHLAYCSPPLCCKCQYGKPNSIPFRNSNQLVSDHFDQAKCAVSTR